ncbi:MAG: alpha-hydroxy-acid oxidizing protein [Cycloclasticus sp.]|nr:alpha-hydroxy-acid oxidizing protein [Cycloclasticus sp.]
MTKAEQLLNLLDYEKAAEMRLEPAAKDYFRSGAMDEHTLVDNIAAFQRIKFLPRVLNNVSHINTHTSFSDHDLSVPLIISPTAFLGMAHKDGELAVAQAASSVNRTVLWAPHINEGFFCSLKKSRPDCSQKTFAQLLPIKWVL